MKTILIADDEPSLRTLVRATLEGRGWTLVEARDGEEALAAVRTQRPDVVVLDHMMPGIDGLTVCRRLRDDPATRDLPVILISASVQQADRVRADEAGVSHFLPKPFSPQALLELVQRLVG